MKLKQVLKKIHNSSPPPQGGYTIMESLVAMVIVAVLMSAVAPVIVLSVGMRVQARRIELGAQAARSYIDAVRSGTIEDPQMAVSDPSAMGTSDPSDPEVRYIDAPGELNCPSVNAYCETEVSAASVDARVYCVDGGDGGDCTGLMDMVVYAIGFNGGSVDPEDGYELFVRVYRGSGFADADKLSDQISSTVNNAGLASRSTANGEIREKPLFSTTTEISPTDNSFQNLRDRL